MIAGTDESKGIVIETTDDGIVVRFDMEDDEVMATFKHEVIEGEVERGDVVKVSDGKVTRVSLGTWSAEEVEAINEKASRRWENMMKMGVFE